MAKKAKASEPCSYTWLDSITLRCHHGHFKILVDPWLRERTIKRLMERGELGSGGYEKNQTNLL